MINIKNLSKSYDGKLAVDNVSLNINDGEICVFIGESGCGKSTILKMINRLVDMDTGSIEINGKSILDEDPEELRRNIGYVVQNVGLFPHLNVGENISLIPKLLKKDKLETLEQTRKLISMVGLDVNEYINKYPNELSGGEAQRVGVARALALNPPIILMDEPFGAVDPLNRVKLQDEFLKLQKEFKKTIIFVTHDLEEAIKMGDKIAIISKGKLHCYDSPKNILKSNNKFVEDFLGKEAFIKVLSKYPISSYIIKENIVLDDKAHLDCNAKDILSIMLEKGKTAISIFDKSTFIGNVYLRDIMNTFKKEN